MLEIKGKRRENGREGEENKKNFLKTETEVRVKQNKLGKVEKISRVLLPVYTCVSLCHKRVTQPCIQHSLNRHIKQIHDDDDDDDGKFVNGRHFVF